MSVYKDTLKISTKGEVDMVDITKEVQKIVSKSGIKDGIVNIFNLGSTGSIITIEYEPGLKKDFPKILERIAPMNEKEYYYHHHETWGDYNGHSHCRASLIGPSLTVPLSNSSLTLGTWQQICFVELDTHPRNRNLKITVIGE
ncbi:MAG: YjbQ family protein [Candidatus Lokiarchaeota archaeon]|nr:YjbQ family protein [Candidatus Lokiarchaeota archaeon]